MSEANISFFDYAYVEIDSNSDFNITYYHPSYNGTWLSETEETEIEDYRNLTGVQRETSSSSSPMDLRVRLVWDFLFISIISIAIVGNLIVLWTVIGEERGRAFIARKPFKTYLCFFLV